MSDLPPGWWDQDPLVYCERCGYRHRRSDGHLPLALREDFGCGETQLLDEVGLFDEVAPQQPTEES